MSSEAALCAICQQGAATPGCPACHDLRDVHRVLAHPHTAFDLAPPPTLRLLDSKPGALVFERRKERWLGFVSIFFGMFVIALMTFVWLSSGNELLPIVIPFDLICLAAVGFGIRDLWYRQTLSLERGTLTCQERGSSKAPITARHIEQLTIDAKHATYWHKGLRWHTRYDLVARTPTVSVVVLSSSHEEVRFLESRFEAALRIADDPSHNTVTTGGLGAAPPDIGADKH